jgi:hypothetical protein
METFCQSPGFPGFPPGFRRFPQVSAGFRYDGRLLYITVKPDTTLEIAE